MKIRIPKKNILLMAVTVAVLLFGTVLAVSAGTGGDPGSVDDPLVTRSYVESQINLRLNEALKTHAQSSMQWQVVDLAPGQRMIGEASTEFIVRYGTTTVVDSTGNGIPDVTTGTNVVSGQNITTNHHFIIPRTDGRGILAKTKAVVMYKGQIEVR